jgi:arginine utilization protein RocB
MLWAGSMFDHSHHCAILATEPGVVLCSLCHLQERCTIMLQCTGSVLTMQFIAYCKHWTLHKSKYCNGNREIYINKQQDGKKERKEERNENVHVYTFFVYISDFIYLDLNINICTVRRESVNCSVPSGVLVSTSVWFNKLCSEPKRELQAILLPATSDSN